MAREYGRILNPPQDLGNIGVGRQWAAQLGVGNVDTDGSKVPKGVTRLKKKFEKALSAMQSGTTRQSMPAPPEGVGTVSCVHGE
jgi:hypothetical protein